MLPQDIVSLENLQLKPIVSAYSQNASLVLPAVAGHTYVLYNLNITADAGFTYTVTQGATTIKAGEGNSTSPVEELYPTGKTTNEDNVPLIVTVLSAGNYSINTGYKLA